MVTVFCPELDRIFKNFDRLETLEDYTLSEVLLVLAMYDACSVAFRAYLHSSKILTIPQGDSYYFSILSNPCTLHWKNQGDKASMTRKVSVQFNMNREILVQLQKH